MRRLTLLKDRVSEWQKLRDTAEDLRGLHELAETEGEADVLADVDQETRTLVGEVGKLEFETLLSSEYAENDALLAIHAGAGGTEAQDWAEMLLRMYVRWAE